MVFSSVTFLFLFLPLTVFSYFAAPRAFRNPALLVASILFYAWGSGLYVLLLFASVIVDFAAGALAYKGVTQARPVLVRAAVVGSVLLNVGLLAYYKYAGFFVSELNRALEAQGIASIGWTAVVLPVGISFYTFQSMSYTIDIAHGRAEPLRSPIDFALYVALFPQLVAGPIVRFHEISRDLLARRSTIEMSAAGALRFAHGLAKKVLVADTVAVLAEQAFSADVGSLSPAMAWLGIVAYTVQIYFDFSGYSDMAIGLGMIFGFRFPENFERPYSAISVTDFWRRWHITLSSWFRDYLYIPLGGGRSGLARTYGNLVAVFVVTGIWHGANWTFIVWGVYHGALLLVERVTSQRPVGNDIADRLVLRRIGVLLAVMIGWVFFRSPTVDFALDYLRVMGGGGGSPSSTELPDAISLRQSVALTLGVGSFFLSPTFVVGKILGMQSPVDSLRRVLSVGAVGLSFAYALIVVVSGQFSPFLYFQF